MTQKSKTKNYKKKTNLTKLGNGAHRTHSRRDESYIVMHFNATAVALDEAVQTYRRYNESGMPIRICAGQIEMIKQLLVTCFVILNGVDDYEFLTPAHERIIREALTIIE